MSESPNTGESPHDSVNHKYNKNPSPPRPQKNYGESPDDDGESPNNSHSRKYRW